MPATDPAHRIGTLFYNNGGPGVPEAVDVETYGAALAPAMARRFDIVGLDPRGVGQSTSVGCHVNEEQLGIYSQPFTTPQNLNVRALIHKDHVYPALPT